MLLQKEREPGAGGRRTGGADRQASSGLGLDVIPAGGERGKAYDEKVEGRRKRSKRRTRRSRR